MDTITGGTENMTDTPSGVKNESEAAQTTGSAQEALDYEKLYQTSENMIKELTAERDSLKAENEKLRTESANAISEAAKVRETNYTLARQLDISQESNKSAEDYLADMFLHKSKGE